MSEDKHSDSESEKTVMRQTPNDDKTNIRSMEDDQRGSGEEKTSAATIVRGPRSKGRATILREPSKDGGDATIIRAPQPNMDKTVIRTPDDEKTVMRTDDGDAGGGPSDDATVMRDGNDDATVIRAGDAGGDDDATVIGAHGSAAGDDDSTVIGNGGGVRSSDTTYIASVGKQIESKGNSEAGRLLKNRFVLEEKLGSGGMGDVYKALDLRAQEAQEKNPYIAIKLLNENFSRHKDAFISLQREASKTRAIPHPNIMGVYDFDREGDTVFMSMELLNGKPLDDYLKEHPEGVSVEDAWNIIDGICEGLMRAHGAGIVHSDFKPGNIFYTKDKMAKVFDFGIARAVKSPGDIQADGEKTVFDAGSLGALTPTYASYEMLKGMQPAKSDDVYAVALVAYELFTGHHPYDRTPADKAYDRGMEPEPIPWLRRRQWKALKRGLALRGEDRTQTVDEFHEELFAEAIPIFRYAAVATLVLGLTGFAGYNFFFGAAEQIPEELVQLRQSQFANTQTFDDQMRSLFREDNNRQLILDANGRPQLKPTLQDESIWESELWHDQTFTSLNRLIKDTVDLENPEHAEWLDEGELARAQDEIDFRKNMIFRAYYQKVQEDVNAAKQLSNDDWTAVQQAIEDLQVAQRNHEHAVNKKYFSYGAQDLVSALNTNLEVAIETKNFRNDFFTQQEEERVARVAAEARAAKEAADAAEALRVRNVTYDGHIATLKDILRCKGDIPSAPGDPNYRDPSDPLYVNTVAKGDEVAVLEQTFRNLQTTFPARWENDYANIVSAVAGCIAIRIGPRAPERAKEVRDRIATFLPDEPGIAGINIVDKDPCNAGGLEGRGSSNRRSCADTISGGIPGPELVVIPGLDRTAGKFAISKYEIKIGDYNEFCQAEGCDVLPGPANHPATNLTIAQAEAYTAWLSDQTGRDYRLPRVNEWRHAAAATTENLDRVDPSVNCTVDARGVSRGDQMATVISGRPNDWGLFHFVGNAREWALDDDGKVYALGGARIDPIADCKVTASVEHDGGADEVTGFRIVRQIVGPGGRSGTSGP